MTDETRKMKNRKGRTHSSRLARCLLTCCIATSLIVTGAIPVLFDDVAWAQKSSKKRKSFVLTPLVFKKMTAIHALLEKEKFSEAIPMLEQLAAKKRLKDFERATVYETFGFTYSALTQYAKAAESFETSLATDALPDASLSTMRFNLAQLYLAEEEFRKAIAHLETWMNEVESPRAGGFYLLGAAHAQLGEAQQALPYVVKAVAKSKKFNETWHQLLLALHFELKNYREAASVLGSLIDRNPKKSYLQQLQGVYSELGEEKKALAVMELSYRQGYLETSDELRNLSHLYLYHEVPNLAAKVLVKGLADGTIEGDSETWELLGDSWIHAREYPRAIEPLRKAAAMSDSGEISLKLARVFLEEHEWNEARDALEAALAKGNLDNPGDAQLMLGISNAKTNRLDAARAAFKNAQKFASSQKSAASWLEHIDNLEAAAARELEAGIKAPSRL